MYPLQCAVSSSWPLLEGTPRLQPWVSKILVIIRALAPGVCPPIPSQDFRVPHLRRFLRLRWDVIPPTRRLLLFSATILLAFPVAHAQAGSGGAAGAAPGVSAPGATVAPAGRGAAQAPTPGQTPTQPGTPQQSSAAAAYAAAAALGPDPRKPPTSRPGALTLRQVLDAAESRNPTLLAARANLNAVRAQELQAGVRANPYFNLNTSNVTEPQYVGNPDSYVAQFSRLFERGGKRGIRLDAARATTAQTQAQLDDTVRQTVLTIKTAFIHMLIAKDALELSEASLKDFRHEVEIANDRYQAGDLGKLDFERLDLQLGSLESDQSNDIVLLQQASAQLQTLMGVETPIPTFDIAGDILPPIVPQTAAQLTATALATRPDYAAARQAILAAEANARLAIANGTADPTFEIEFDRTGHENSVGAYVNIPIRIFDRNQGNKATTRFQADSSRLTAIAARNQVVTDVTQAFIGYEQAKRLADRFTTALPRRIPATSSPSPSSPSSTAASPSSTTSTPYATPAPPPATPSTPISKPG